MSTHISIYRYIADSKGLQHENDFDNIPKLQEGIKGSLAVGDTRTNELRPPPTGVYYRNFKLCK